MLNMTAKILLVFTVGLFVAAWLACPDHDEQLTSAAGEQVIDMRRSDAWARLQDLTLAHLYVPGLIKTEITTDKKTGPGASRRVYQTPDTYLNETVIEWDEGYGFTLRLHQDNGDAPFPFKHALFTYQLGDHGNDQTRLSTVLRYKLAGGCLGHWLNKLLQSTFQQRADEVASNLKRFYETGQAVNNE